MVLNPVDIRQRDPRRTAVAAALMEALKNEQPMFGQPMPSQPAKPASPVEVASAAPLADLYISPKTRAHYRPSADALNISMDFNAAPSGSARGTEVIIPDNASPEVRAAAERYNQMVAEFAARNGITDYPIRGVRTRSENGRGVPFTVHTEPFFNSDLAFQEAVKKNPAEFAAIYREAFAGVPGARLIAPHGVGRDRGAASSIFGDETSYGELIANTLLQGGGGAGRASAPIISTSGRAQGLDGFQPQATRFEVDPGAPISRERLAQMDMEVARQYGPGATVRINAQGQAQVVAPNGGRAAQPAVARGQQPQPMQAQSPAQLQAYADQNFLPLSPEMMPRLSTQEIRARLQQAQQQGLRISPQVMEQVRQQYELAQLAEGPFGEIQLRRYWTEKLGYKPPAPQFDPATRILTDEQERQFGLDPAGVYAMDNKGDPFILQEPPQAGAVNTQYVDGVGLIDKNTGDVIRTYDAAGTGEGMNEGERRIFMFGQMQEQTSPAINMIEDQGFNPANIQDKLAGGVLGGNFFKTTEGQMYGAAAAAWIEGALRLSTGAAANESEFPRIMNTYFAAVGDSPETIAFKRSLREAYQGVIEATLQGNPQAELPQPITFAVQQYYQNRAAAPQPPAPSVQVPQQDAPAPALDDETLRLLEEAERLLNPATPQGIGAQRRDAR